MEKKKTYWKKEYDKKRNSNEIVLSSRFSEEEAMWIYGEATNRNLSVSKFIRKKALEDYEQSKK